MEGNQDGKESQIYSCSVAIEALNDYMMRFNFISNSK